MTAPHPHTIGETLEQTLERAIFSDPATHPMRAQWEETKRIEQAVFECVCREEYERRLDYHRICQTPNPEESAGRETALVKLLLKEELDARLTERWTLVLRKVQALLAERRDESEDTLDTSSDSRVEGKPST